jgi:hypothetical protein
MSETEIRKGLDGVVVDETGNLKGDARHQLTDLQRISRSRFGGELLF